METSRFIQLRKIFDAAILLPASQWESFLQGTCNDEALRAEVKELLLAHLNDASTDSADVLEPAGSTRMIGPYRIVRELGAGGMGVVYLAVRDDGAFRKNVAVKLLKHRQSVPGLVQRFHQERQVLANLDHPNIARLLDGGQAEDGVPYYVMEYVEGLALDHFCDTQKLDLADRIRLFQQVVSAVQYLHQNLIVHRDLKHSNILVTGDGVVKLLDFGIAKTQTPIPDAPDLTGPGNRLLTPNYASPEQIAGAPVAKASDIYSLGVVLYELLTGRLPYPSAASKLEGDPPLPSANIREDLKRMPGTTAQLRRRIVGDLDQIVLLCLRRDPRHRYASAAALSEDLESFLDGRSVMARKEPMLERTVRFLKRKRVAVGVAALILLSCSVGAWKTIQAHTQALLVQASQDELKRVLDGFDQKSGAAGTGSAADSTRRLDNVRKLAHALQPDSASAKSAQAAMTPQRRAWLERAAKYLDSMETYAAQNSALAAELARAYMEIGILFQPSYRDLAITAYDSAAHMLQCAAGGDPSHSAYKEQWTFVLTRITSLGGAVPVVNPVETTSSAEKPKLSMESSSAPSAQPEESATEEQPQPTPTPIDPAEYNAVKRRLDSAITKGQIADRVMQSIEASTQEQGQQTHPDIVAKYKLMNNALESARRALESGDLAAAKENIVIATACAKWVMNAGGQ